MTSKPARSTRSQPQPRQTARPRARWLLPEDGIVDEIAVAIAASGVRPVRLTHTERRLAAAIILGRPGGTPHLVARRVRMNHATAVALAADLAAPCESGEAAA